MAGRPLPDKLFFKIGEVADIVGVETHVLRYWESEFPALAPKKTRGGHRQYSRKDVELAMHIRALVHDEGFTIAGAKKHLRKTDRHRRSSEAEPSAARLVGLRTELLGLREQMVGILRELDTADEAEPDEPVGTVTVTKVVPGRLRTRKD